jgi:tetratricopeptide (TPR) repeat protein
MLAEPPYDKLTDSIEKEPSRADLYYKRGTLLYGNNQVDLAQKDIRKAWELNPQEESYALSLTTVLKQKNTDAAISFLEEALQKLPNSISLQIGLARGYEQKKQIDKALAICDRILNNAPGQVDALLLKAELLKQQDKGGDAISNLERAYRMAPGDVEVVHNLAFEYAEASNAKVLALSDSLIAADTEGSHAEPYYFKGVYYSNAGNPAEAIRQFDEAIRHNYNFLDAYINKGIVYYDQKKYEQALKVFNLASTVSPDEAEPYYWQAKAQEAMGNKAEAKLNYQRAYGLDKTMTEAKTAADRL